MQAERIRFFSYRPHLLQIKSAPLPSDEIYLHRHSVWYSMIKNRTFIKESHDEKGRRIIL